MTKPPAQGRRTLNYGAKDLRTLRDPTTIPAAERTLADAFIGLSGEELRKVLLQGQMLAALDLANRPPEK